MIEERHVELIHAELDGELTSEQRAELSRALLANPEARALRDQLSWLFGDLAKLEDAAPPPDLATSVLSAIGRRAGTPGPALPARRSWFTGPAFRYAAVFVGGLLLAALVFSPDSPGVVGPDVSELVGTIGGHGAAGHGSPVDSVELDLAQVTGAVNSYQLDGQLVVELDLTAGEQIEVIATYSAQTVNFSLGRQGAATPERVIWLPTAAPQAGGRVDLEIYGRGRLLHRESLRTSRNG